MSRSERTVIVPGNRSAANLLTAPRGAWQTSLARSEGMIPLPGRVSPVGGIVMLNLQAPGVRLCDGITRREMLRAGSLGLFGLSLPALLRGQQLAAASTAPLAGT